MAELDTWKLRKSWIYYCLLKFGPNCLCLMLSHFLPSTDSSLQVG